MQGSALGNNGELELQATQRAQGRGFLRRWRSKTVSNQLCQEPGRSLPSRSHNKYQGPEAEKSLVDPEMERESWWDCSTGGGGGGTRKEEQRGEGGGWATRWPGGQQTSPGRKTVTYGFDISHIYISPSTYKSSYRDL